VLLCNDTVLSVSRSIWVTKSIHHLLIAYKYDRCIVLLFDERSFKNLEWPLVATFCNISFILASALTTKAANSSVMLVRVHQFTLCHIPVFRLSKRHSWELPSSAILRSVTGCLFTMFPRPYNDKLSKRRWSMEEMLPLRP
jgi:hypothetical protein